MNNPAQGTLAMHSDANTVIRETAAASSAGNMHFGEVVARLTEAGVEAYAVDYRCQRATYYLASGEQCDLELRTPEIEIGQSFDILALTQAIRGSQQGRVKYPEFKRLSMAAGCVGYTVWIAGRHVCYFGRRGETHIEAFPD